MWLYSHETDHRVAIQSKFIRLITTHISLLVRIYSPNIIEGFVCVPGTVLGSSVSKDKAGREERHMHACTDNTKTMWEECAWGYWNPEERVTPFSGGRIFLEGHSHASLVKIDRWRMEWRWRRNVKTKRYTESGINFRQVPTGWDAGHCLSADSIP